MSVLTDLIYAGSNAVAGLTEGAVNDAIAKYGADKKVAFPDTAYFLPTIYAATGVKVTKLSDLTACVGVLKSLISNKEDLGEALNAGLATAVGAEIIEALKYVASENPYEGESGIGFVPEPTNPVTPGVLRTTYQERSLTIMSTKAYPGKTFFLVTFFLPSLSSVSSSIGTTTLKISSSMPME